MTEPDSLADLIAEKARQRQEAFSGRHEKARQQRKQLHEARQHGLRARHASRLREPDTTREKDRS